MKKSISVILLAIILLQSCVVYQKTPVSIDEAYNVGRVKIEKEAGQSLYYKNIVIENGEYYGNFKGYTTIVDTSIIKSVYLKDIKRSKKATIVVFGVIIPLTIGLGIFIHNARNFGG